MEFNNLIESIEFELVLEGIGCIFGFALLWQFFFQDKLQILLIHFITSIC